MTNRTTFSLALVVLLASCQVGPEYGGPPVSAPRAANAPAFVRAGPGTLDSSPPVARWWEALDDATLTALEMRALDANPDLAAAAARLRQARAGLREQKANLLPKSGAIAVYAHARLPGLDLGTDSVDGGNGPDTGGGQQNGGSNLDFYNLGLDASWEIDLFGGQHRAIQAARATAESTAAKLADAQVSLTAEVAQVYVNIRVRQRRIALNRRSIAMQQQMLVLTRQRFAQGAASRIEVERLSQRLDGARADATPLAAELDAYLDELATLTGDEPGALDGLLATATPAPLPPAQVAIGDPAGLLRRRPDIRAAERTLAAETAKIGQAEAARFPRVSFMGIVGIGGTKPSNLTDLDDFNVLAAPQLSWSFLDFGRNAARVRQAESVRDEADARYRAVVLAALRDAEDALSRFRNRRGTVATRARAKESADEVAALSRQRYVAGTLTLIDRLDAERRQIDADQDLTITEAALTSDFILIQKELGLGWSEDDVATTSLPPQAASRGYQPRSK